MGRQWRQMAGVGFTDDWRAQTHRATYAIWNQKWRGGVFTDPLPPHIATGTNPVSCYRFIALTRISDWQRWRQVVAGCISHGAGSLHHTSR